MLPGFLTVGRMVVVFALAGAILGALIGAVTDNYLTWIGLMAAVGAGFGAAIGYGLLPEA